MRWPWVSRAYSDAVAKNIEDVRQYLTYCEQERLASEKRYDALLDKYHALKLSGATLPEPSVARPERESDPVVQAINEASAGRPALRAQMLRQLVADRRDPLLEDVELIRRIQGGVPAFEDGVPG